MSDLTQREIDRINRALNGMTDSLFDKINSKSSDSVKEDSTKFENMENAIRYFLKEFKHFLKEFKIDKANSKEQKIFVNLDGDLKDNAGNILSQKEESMIRTWHSIDKKEPIYAVFYAYKEKEGDFFTADRSYYFTTCIREGGISFAGIIQTDGWDKEKDGILAIGWEEIEDISFAPTIDLTTECNTPNAHFIPHDPAFNIYEKLPCVIFHSIEDNSYINIPALYFANKMVDYSFIIHLLKSILSQYKVFSSKNEEYFSKLGEELSQLMDNKEYQKLNDKIEEVREEVYFWIYYYYKITSLLELSRTSEAYKLFDDFKATFKKEYNEKEKNDALFGYFTLTEAKIYHAKGELYEAACCYNQLKELEEKSDYRDDRSIAEFERDKKEAYNSFLTKFREINYNDRKVITIAKTDSLFKSDHITLLQMNNLPAVNFPITHPKQDHTYICHPYKTDSYLPIENYDYELLNDRINEFCYLLQCLGATSIFIENIKGESNDTNTHSDSKLNLEAGIRSSSGKVNIENEHKGRDYSKSMLKIGREQQFNPIRPPYVPEGLVWFPHEATWHRLVQQRLEGSLLNHSEYMSSTEHKILSNSEIFNINGELNLLFTSIKGGYKSDNNSNIETNQEVEWRINVTFKPIEQFGNESRIVEVIPIQELTEHKEPFTSEEIQYMDEVRFMLEDDAAIDDQERRMLNEMQKTLGISAERAQELEKEVVNNVFSFNANEQKYIEEIKFMLEDDGMIDEQERKILDNMLDVLNISPERAQQLEVIVLNRGDLTKEEKEYLVKVKSFISDGTISDRERRMLNRLANLLGISEQRAVELENQL